MRSWFLLKAMCVFLEKGLCLLMPAVVDLPDAGSLVGGQFGFINGFKQ